MIDSPTSPYLTEYMERCFQKTSMNKDFNLTEFTVKGKKVLIYDNCLPTDVFKHLQDIILSDQFPWYYNPSIATLNVKSPIEGYENDNEGYQFVHPFYRIQIFVWSPLAEIIYPVLELLNPRAWLRVKANMGPRYSKHLVGGWHYDAGLEPTRPYVDSLTAQLFMNTNNGYTLMESGDKIKSVENRLMLHPCDILHTGISQTDTKVRVVLNFNFF